jgi:hypothetical protein
MWFAVREAAEVGDLRSENEPISRIVVAAAVDMTVKFFIVLICK